MSTFKSQMKQHRHSFVWLSPREKKLETNQLFLIWCIWLWFIWLSVKILIALLWFLQNSSHRSCFKGSLLPSIWSYIMLQPLKNQRKIVPLFSFTFSLAIRMVLGLLKWLKETRFYERKKKITTAWTLHKRKVHIKMEL